MNDDKKKGPMILDPEKDEISVFIAEPHGERQIVEKEDGMTDEDVARDQRIIDRITGHYIPTPSESDVDEISVHIAENPGVRRTPVREEWMTDGDYARSQRILDRITGHHDDEAASSENLIREPWMSDEDYRRYQEEYEEMLQFQREESAIQLIVAIDPDTIKSYEDLIPNRESWMSDDFYRSQIETMFLFGAALGIPLTDEVWAHVGLSPEYDDPDYHIHKLAAPADLNFVADLSDPDDLKTAEQWQSWTPVWTWGLTEQNFFELSKLSLQCFRLDNDIELLSDDAATEWVLGRLEKSGVDLDLIDPAQEPEPYLEAADVYIELKAKLDAAMPSDLKL